jgi:hypothetical protein
VDPERTSPAAKMTSAAPQAFEASWLVAMTSVPSLVMVWKLPRQRRAGRRSPSSPDSGLLQRH